MFPQLLKNELLKLFGKKRTYIGFGAFLVVQVGMLQLFRFSHVRTEFERLLSGNGYLAQDYISALTVAMFMLMPQVMLLMPLYAALVGGDMMAKEVEDGTLRMILSRPVSRLELVWVKWVAGAIFCIILVLALGATALGLARLWFPWHGMFVMGQNVFNVLDASEGFRRFLFSHLFMTFNASVIFGLALMFSCFNMKPAAATVLSLSFVLVSLVMENIPFFEHYREWFLTYHFNVWHLVFAKPIPWERIAGSLCVLMAVNLTALLVGTAAFQARDIKS
jgi:ABC-2 type transport system permease protein